MISVKKSQTKKFSADRQTDEQTDEQMDKKNIKFAKCRSSASLRFASLQNSKLGCIVVDKIDVVFFLVINSNDFRLSGFLNILSEYTF